MNLVCIQLKKMCKNDQNKLLRIYTSNKTPKVPCFPWFFRDDAVKIPTKGAVMMSGFLTSGGEERCFFSA